MVRIYSCEGNIGAGKTTLINHLEQISKVIEPKKILLLREPVDMWEKVCDDNGKNILKHFYENPREHAFAFQVLAFSTRLAMIKDAVNENPNCDVIICERSIYADGHIFAKMLYDDKMIENIHYEIYKTMYENAVRDFPLSGVIYLTIGPEDCAQRIKTRGRPGEENIPMEYLEKCHKYHKIWLEDTSQPFHIKRLNIEEANQFIESGNITDLINIL